MVFNWSGFARVYNPNAAEACNIKDLPPGVFCCAMLLFRSSFASSASNCSRINLVTVKQIVFYAKETPLGVNYILYPSERLPVSHKQDTFKELDK
jgi:hypothetical protein